jgi:hypothetical protein
MEWPRFGGVASRQCRNANCCNTHCRTGRGTGFSWWGEQSGGSAALERGGTAFDASPGPADRTAGVLLSGTGSRSNVTPLSRSELDCGAKRFRKGRLRGLPLYKHSKQVHHARRRTAINPGCSGSTDTSSGSGQSLRGVSPTSSGDVYAKSHGEEILRQESGDIGVRGIGQR